MPEQTAAIKPPEPKVRDHTALRNRLNELMPLQKGESMSKLKVGSVSEVFPQYKSLDLHHVRTTVGLHPDTGYFITFVSSNDLGRTKVLLLKPDSHGRQQSYSLVTDNDQVESLLERFRHNIHGAEFEEQEPHSRVGKTRAHHAEALTRVLERTLNHLEAKIKPNL